MCCDQKMPSIRLSRLVRSCSNPLFPGSQEFIVTLQTDHVSLVVNADQRDLPPSVFTEGYNCLGLHLQVRPGVFLLQVVPETALGIRVSVTPLVQSFQYGDWVSVNSGSAQGRFESVAPARKICTSLGVKASSSGTFILLGSDRNGA